MIDHTHPDIEARLDHIDRMVSSMSMEIGLILEQLNTLTRTTAEILAILRDRGPN